MLCINYVMLEGEGEMYAYIQNSEFFLMRSMDGGMQTITILAVENLWTAPYSKNVKDLFRLKFT